MISVCLSLSLCAPIVHKRTIITSIRWIRATRSIPKLWNVESMFCTLLFIGIQIEHYANTSYMYHHYFHRFIYLIEIENDWANVNANARERIYSKINIPALYSIWEQVITLTLRSMPFPLAFSYSFYICVGWLAGSPSAFVSQHSLLLMTLIFFFHFIFIVLLLALCPVPAPPHRRNKAKIVLHRLGVRETFYKGFIKISETRNSIIYKNIYMKSKALQF